MSQPVASDTRRVSVAGTDVAYRRWGGEGADGCLLVHGIAAHSGWWDDVAAQIGRQRPVAAIDLSGHGDSGHRLGYSREMWAEELIAITDAEGWRRPVLVGHSLGGMVALRAAAIYPDRFAGVCVMESNITDEPPLDDPALTLGRPHRGRSSRAEIVQRWHTLPPEPVDTDVARRVADQSVRLVEDGWVWKFDPDVFRSAVMVEADLERLRIPSLLCRGEHGAVTEDRLARLAEIVGPQTTQTVLPGVGHNVMLAAPQLVTDVVSSVLDAWTTPTMPETPTSAGAVR